MQTSERAECVTGHLRDPAGTVRRVMCRACTNFVWTKARRFEGRCGPCRRKNVPAKYRPAIEANCVDCGKLVSSQAKRRRCDACRAQRNRDNASNWYYRVKRPKLPRFVEGDAEIRGEDAE